MSSAPTETDRLRALLGDRYNDVIEDAARAMQEGCGSWPWGRMCSEMPAWADEWRRNATHALVAVLPRLLKDAWDEGYDAGWDDLATTLTVAIALLSTHPRQPTGRETARALRGLTDTPNPYRATATATHCDRGPCHLLAGHGGPCNPGDDANTNERNER